MFQVVKTDHQIRRVAVLAEQIWRNHYTPIIGGDQVTYMLKKFQSFQPIKEQIAGGMDYYLVGEDDGYFAIKPAGEYLFLSKFYLKISKRGLGLGKKMFQKVETLAKELDLKGIELTVNKNNSNTINIYKKLGFTIVEAVVFDIGNGYLMDDYRLVRQF